MRQAWVRVAWVVGGGCALLMAGVLVRDRLDSWQAQAAQQAEVTRIREALLRAADNAERAHRARTTPEQREAEQAAAMRAFQAAEAETLRGQAAAKAARDARRADGTTGPETTDQAGR